MTAGQGPGERPAVHVNVSNHLRDRAVSQGNDLAVAVARSPGFVPGMPTGHGEGGYDSLTFAELDQWVDRTARALTLYGIGKGTRTALMVPPCTDFFALVFALFRIEAELVLIDPGLGVGWVRGCLAEAGIEAFVGVPKAHLARILLGWGKSHGAGKRRRLRTVSVGGAFGGRIGFGGPPLRSLIARAEREIGGAPVPTPASGVSQTAAVLFTSGSTGPPKGALYRHGMFASQVELLRATYGIAPGERDLATFPLFALFGPALGMAAVVPRMDTSRPASADPEKLLRAFRDWQCTNLFASPALIDKLGRHLEQHEAGLPGLRRAISAGAPMQVPVLRRFVRALDPGAELFTPYGATESLPISSIGSSEILAETQERTEKGGGVCVGRPVTQMEVRIIAIDENPIGQWGEAEVLPGPGERGSGAIGEIVVRGPVVSLEYVSRPEANALSKIVDGDSIWHRTGDVGYFDDQGRLWMCGRKSHRVETGEEVLFTVPCEAIFNAHPAVFRSALVGVPRAAGSSETGQEPVVLIELEESVRSEAGPEIRRQLEAELLTMAQSHDHTRSIQTLLFHPGFPVDVRHNAKIFREKLAPWAARRLGR